MFFPVFDPSAPRAGCRFFGAVALGPSNFPNHGEIDREACASAVGALGSIAKSPLRVVTPKRRWCWHPGPQITFRLIWYGSDERNGCPES